MLEKDYKWDGEILVHIIQVILDKHTYVAKSYNITVINIPLI